ncbi:MAG TPA: slipin family protein [Candidatus Limnocylindrales bacterium]|nr:slipin family protein [Candidatus Limnocylindrales bacterium]
MEAFIGPLIVLVAVLLLALLVRATVRVVTVHDYERGLRYRRGRFSGLVDPGTHITIPPYSEVRVLDGRPSSMTIEGQEVLTSDGVSLKVSLVARYVVGDPVAAVTNDQSFGRAMHLELQLGLREVVATATVDELLASRARLGPAVLERCASQLARIGIELLACDIRDLMVPGELKRVFAGVVAARKEGEASLERVRAETAALRNLANAGRLVEDNPGLLQLRMLQQVGGSSGNTVMLTMPDGASGGAAAQPAAAETTAKAARARSRQGPGSEPSPGSEPTGE